MRTRQVLISLGSNIDPAQQRVQAAVDILTSTVLDRAVFASMYLTPPLGYTDQPKFVNTAVMGYTDVDAHVLHRTVKELETTLGRVHRDMWHQREIDIDIILLGDEIITSLSLNVPHLRFRDRRFVLQPSAEIAPTMVDPVTNKTISQLLQSCSDASVLERL